MNDSAIIINKASLEDFSIITNYIKLFELDNRELYYNQFVVAKKNQSVIGFGRIRKHNGCDEFCSLGVVEEYRKHGIAKLLIEERIKLATQPIYMCTIIPNYFEKLGFVVTKEYPIEMSNKLDYCTHSLIVPEPYVVMKYLRGL